MRRTRNTYPLSHFRQHTRDHLKRIAAGEDEVITQNGEAAFVVLSPDRHDAMTEAMDAMANAAVHALERGHLWNKAIARIGKEPGKDAMARGTRPRNHAVKEHRVRYLDEAIAALRETKASSRNATDQNARRIGFGRCWRPSSC